MENFRKLMQDLVGIEGLSVLDRALSKNASLPFLTAVRSVSAWVAQAAGSLKKGEKKEFAMPGQPELKVSLTGDDAQAAQAAAKSILTENEIYSPVEKSEGIEEMTPVIGKLVDSLMDAYKVKKDIEEVLGKKEGKQIEGDEQKVEEDKTPEEIAKEKEKAIKKDPSVEQATATIKEIDQLAAKRKLDTKEKTIEAPGSGGKISKATEYLRSLKKTEELSKPPVSQAQRGAMYAAAAGKSTLGIPKKVGKEFADADKGGKLPEHVKKGDDKLPGGLADNKKPSDFKSSSLKAGAEVEKEHTKDPKVAREIAMDHLTEDKGYYKKLSQMVEKGDTIDMKTRKPLTEAPAEKPKSELHQKLDHLKNLHEQLKGHLADLERLTGGSEGIEKAGAMGAAPAGGAAIPKMAAMPSVSVMPSKKPKLGANKVGAQPASTKPMGKQPAVKMPAMKSEADGCATDSKGYFKKRLDKIAKSQTVYHVSEEEIYTPCRDCGVPEFVKSEAGPKFNPCMCFFVMKKSADGKKTWFVDLAKTESGYRMKFNPKADDESVKAFLLTLKATMLAKKRLVNED